MFNFFKKKIKEVDPQPSAREKFLEKECNRLTILLDELKSKSRDSSFSFDFGAVNAFSIERNWKNSDESTIIGYTLDEQEIHTDGRIIDKSKVHEWYLYCSQSQHEKLVEEFNKFKKGK